MQKWKKLGSKVILDHPRIKVVEDKVELPNGEITDYVRIESRGNSAEIIAQNLEGKILLSQEYSYPPDEILWQFPGGHVPEDENPEVGANRELMEEAGLRAGNLKFLGNYWHNNRRSNMRAFVYLATGLTEEKREGDLEEVIENYWFSPDEIDQMIDRGEVTNLHTLGAWMLFKAKGNK